MSIEVLIGFGIVIIGWVYTYGKLSQKVDGLQKAINNGLCEKVDGISRQLARLEGVVEGLKDKIKP